MPAVTKFETSGISPSVTGNTTEFVMPAVTCLAISPVVAWLAISPVVTGNTTEFVMPAVTKLETSGIVGISPRVTGNTTLSVIPAVTKFETSGIVGISPSVTGNITESVMPAVTKSDISLTVTYPLKSTVLKTSRKLIVASTVRSTPPTVPVARTTTFAFAFAVSPLTDIERSPLLSIDAPVSVAEREATVNVTVAPDGLFRFSSKSETTTPLKAPSLSVNTSIVGNQNHSKISVSASTLVL